LAQALSNHGTNHINETGTVDGNRKIEADALANVQVQAQTLRIEQPPGTVAAAGDQ